MANIVQIAAQFRQALIDQDREAIAEMTRRWLALEKLFSADVLRLVEEIIIYREGNMSDREIAYKLQQSAVYQKLLAEVRAAILDYTSGAIPLIEDRIGAAQTLAAGHAAGLVEAVSGGRVNLSPFATRLPREAIENITAISRAGQPLYNLLENAYPRAALGITNELIYGIAAGRNPRDTARAILRKGLAQGYNHILLVARDQQIRNYREMTRTIYDRSDVVTSYVRLAAKNTRTCLACFALDGTIYETSELMAIHPQDRCSQVPVVSGFPPPRFQTGEEWFRRQPEAVQRKMMGPGKYDEWKNGRFTFSQLVTVTENETWGPNAQVTSLTALLDGKGGVERARI